MQRLHTRHPSAWCLLIVALKNKVSYTLTALCAHTIGFDSCDRKLVAISFTLWHLLHEAMFPAQIHVGESWQLLIPVLIEREEAVTAVMRRRREYLAAKDKGNRFPETSETEGVTYNTIRCSCAARTASSSSPPSADIPPSSSSTQSIAAVLDSSSCVACSMSSGGAPLDCTILLMAALVEDGKASVQNIRVATDTVNTI